MEITRVRDGYNSNKVWIIKKTKCRHYYLNQEICGRMFYSKFVRVSKRYLEDLFAVGC